ncbi:uncharacterized protein [Porites lutea]|uniref:uncharacterized protein n=1 Tax=Porites lutea TaxID=51062 RepID=UPI003CC523CE
MLFICLTGIKMGFRVIILLVCLFVTLTAARKFSLNSFRGGSELELLRMTEFVELILHAFTLTAIMDRRQVAAGTLVKANNISTPTSAVTIINVQVAKYAVGICRLENKKDLSNDEGPRGRNTLL